MFIPLRNFEAKSALCCKYHHLPQRKHILISRRCSLDLRCCVARHSPGAHDMHVIHTGENPYLETADSYVRNGTTASRSTSGSVSTFQSRKRYSPASDTRCRVRCQRQSRRVDPSSNLYHNTSVLPSILSRPRTSAFNNFGKSSS